MLASFLTTPVVVSTPGSKANSVGDLIPDWSPGAVTTQDAKVWVEPKRGSEDDDLRQMDKLQVRLFFDVSVSVTAGDRVAFDGETFEVDGPPLMRSTPRGPHHKEARCTAIVG